MSKSIKLSSLLNLSHGNASRSRQHVFAGYFNLIFYDLLALHTIGKRRIPFLVIAFTSFTSYTIGHSLGAATLTCGFVRFRVYSSWNLTVVDIAKIALITGATFWIGNISVLGGAATHAPQTLGVIDHLPSWLNRLAGLCCLAAIGCYLAWLTLRPRIIGFADWKIMLPNNRGAGLQIAIGVMDRCLASLAFFTLLPNQPGVGFITVLVAFVIATLIGTISHAPGSLRVVEAALLICLPQFQREELLATILIFRVLDFFIPLSLATAMFGLRELWLFARRTSSGSGRDGHSGRSSASTRPGAAITRALDCRLALYRACSARRGSNRADRNRYAPRNH